MKSIYDNWDFWQKLLSMLENQFGNRCEIILHDLTKDYAHTVVDIRNGHITGRKVGDCGSNLGLEVLRGEVKDGDRYNYVVHTPDGKILRSSTMFLYDEDKRAIGSLCINLDITQTIAMEGFLHQYNGYIPDAEPKKQEKETFAGNISDVLDFLIEQAAELSEKSVEEMSRNEKIRFVGYLDAKGAFLITKASDRVCDYLKISRFTLYNYLDLARTEKKE
ncbi:helix-turn-helix transcriptional regulator [Lacrimispora indolis]|uniref:helix-turn-helix transcriptional regulator n=1 Tax=Lacrimispora indolis TaxID=69825 RepID=UPI0003F77D5E|nr:helix-turn-helix transcriptional regulator [[Clostridium] methoxybenzovorans]